MKLKQLFEGPQSDKEQRQMAVNAWRGFIQYLRSVVSNEPSLQDIERMRRDFGIIEKNNGAINVYYRFPEDYGGSDDLLLLLKGKMQSTGSPAAFDRQMRAVVLYPVERVDIQNYNQGDHIEMLDGILDELTSNPQYQSSFIHEFTHYMDINVKGSGEEFKIANPDDDGKDAYLNDPAEVNARYQQVVDELENKIEMKRKPDGSMGERDLDKIFSSFNRFLSNIGKTVLLKYHLHEDQINEQNYKKILRRLSQWWQEEKEEQQRMNEQ